MQETEQVVVLEALLYWSIMPLKQPKSELAKMTK